MTIRFNSSPQASGPAFVLRLHVEAFDDYLRNERGLAQTTIDTYKPDDALLAFLEGL